MAWSISRIPDAEAAAAVNRHSRMVLSAHVPGNLDRSQLEAFRWYAAGKTVGLMGPAGAGKTFTLQVILHDGRSSRPRGAVVALAMTNAQAQEIGGVTVNRFFGMPVIAEGPGSEWTASMPRERYRLNAAVKSRVDGLCVQSGLLILDEVPSMASSQFEAVFAFLLPLGLPQMASSLIIVVSITSPRLHSANVGPSCRKS